VLASVMDRFRFLKIGVAAILIFVGLKMVLSRWVHLSVMTSLGVIVGCLVISVLASIWADRSGGDNTAK
jgi:tellurite resistance protein TerC